MEGEVGEGFYDCAFAWGVAFALETVELEVEACGFVRGPEMRGLCLDGGVEVGVGGAGAPEGVDGVG